VLQRQLENAGTSFRKLKDEVLKEHALSAINQATDIKTIAEQLGYTELSGFYRIFKGWFGITPKKALKEGVLNSKK
jgi:AraC-like DNA-binding protein